MVTILVYIENMCLIIHIVPFYSHKFWNMGIQGNENLFFTCYFKVVLGQFLEIWSLSQMAPFHTTENVASL